MIEPPPSAWPDQRPQYPQDELISNYLLLDIQHASAWAEELCEHVRLVGSGEEESWTRVGNAYHLILTHDTASIEALGDPDGTQPTLVALSEFRVAAERWRERLNNRKAD